MFFVMQGPNAAGMSRVTYFMSLSALLIICVNLLHLLLYGGGGGLLVMREVLRKVLLQWLI